LICVRIAEAAEARKIKAKVKADKKGVSKKAEAAAEA
jgi:hypothetical protein